MKLPSFLSIIVITSLFLLACKCKEDDDGMDEPTLAEIQLNALRAHTWIVVTVMRGDETATVFYEGFTIAFEGNLNGEKTNVENGTFTTTNGGKTFSEEGTWAFDEADVKTMMILDGRETEYFHDDSGDKETLRLTFQYDGDEGGRFSGVAGDYVFDLEEAL